MNNLHKVPFWSNTKVQKLFKLLCERSEKRCVDWKKFRLLDKKGIFSKYTDVHLSVEKMYMNRFDQGLCIKCGVAPHKEDSARCEKCNVIVRNASKKYYKDIKKEDLDEDSI